MTGKELWDYMSAIQSEMEPQSTAGYEWDTLPITVQYVWTKAGLGLEKIGENQAVFYIDENGHPL